jgi:hypothetical protein
MPNPISTSGASTCDPNIASCTDFPPAAPLPAVSSTPTVNLEPIVVTGDAGAQALLRSYDASQACGPQKQALSLACLAIPVGVVDGGISSAFLASLNCGKDLQALSDCRDDAQALQSSATQVIDDCHDRGGNVSAASSRNEIICEVTK